MWKDNYPMIENQYSKLSTHIYEWKWNLTHSLSSLFFFLWSFCLGWVFCLYDDDDDVVVWCDHNNNQQCHHYIRSMAIPKKKNQNNKNVRELWKFSSLSLSLPILSLVIQKRIIFEQQVVPSIFFQFHMKVGHGSMPMMMMMMVMMIRFNNFNHHFKMSANKKRNTLIIRR